MSNSLTKAYYDPDFLGRDELRGIRLQTEMLKPQILMAEQRVVSTVVVFGSARTPSPEMVQALEATADTEALWAAVNAARDAGRYYDMAREFGRQISRFGQATGDLEYVVATGGGPGIMEAANRGAHDVGAKSIGFNITLPHEQHPNPYITPELNFMLHYFSIRKMHFLIPAKALCAFPGGFGTMDELFETLTLVQTAKTERIPIILFGREFWDNLINWQLFADRGMISPEDLDLWNYVDNATDAVDIIRAHYRADGQPS